MTPAKQTILARMSDGEWRFMQDHAPDVLAKLYRADMIRCDNDHIPTYERFFTITPDGLNVVEAAQ